MADNKKTWQSKKKNSRKAEAGAWLALLLAGVLILLYYFGDRNFCPLYGTIGLPCPFCGMTRAWMFLLRGRPDLAFFYHPLFFFIPLLILSFVFYGRFSERGKKRIRFIWIAAALVFSGVWLLRLRLYFPSEEPMQVNPDAFIPIFGKG